MQRGDIRALTFDVLGFDLEGAKALGFKTAFVRRVGEEVGDPTTAPYVDVIAEHFQDLALQLSR